MSNLSNIGSLTNGTCNTAIGNTTLTTGWDASTIKIHSGSSTGISSGTIVSSGISSGTIVGSSTGITLGSVNTAYGSYTIGASQDMIDFYELILAALGYDISYQDFAKMTKEQRKSLLRDVKLKRLID